MKQLTVFIENCTGRLEKVTGILSSHNINIVCVSLADTNDYGMLRMVVSQPAAACEALSAEGFSSMLTDVMAVKLPHSFGSLNSITHILKEGGIDIRYVYGLTSGEDAAVILKTSDNEAAERLLGASGEFTVMSAVDVYNM